jgi:hypothetical protein
MNITSEYVIDTLNSIADKLRSGTMSPAQAEQEFLQNVSKKQLESCLTDSDLDADDMNACKEMLKHYYNFEPNLN